MMIKAYITTKPKQCECVSVGLNQIHNHSCYPHQMDMSLLLLLKEISEADI